MCGNIALSESNGINISTVLKNCHSQKKRKWFVLSVAIYKPLTVRPPMNWKLLEQQCCCRHGLRKCRSGEKPMLQNRPTWTRHMPKSFFLRNNKPKQQKNCFNYSTSQNELCLCSCTSQENCILTKSHCIYFNSLNNSCWIAPVAIWLIYLNWIP